MKVLNKVICIVLVVTFLASILPTGQMTSDSATDASISQIEAPGNGFPFEGGSTFPDFSIDGMQVEISPLATERYGDYDFDKETGTIIKYYGDGGDITIPEQIDGEYVTVIGESAFESCDNLTRVIIPNSVKDIKSRAFANCIFVSVTIPDSVTNIGDYAFYNCYKLTSVTIPGSVKSIGNYAFAQCLIRRATLLNGVISIGDSAFSECILMTSVTIPDSVTSIGDSAFSFCSTLASVIIPSSVTTIGIAAFDYCLALTSVSIPSSVTSIENYTFAYCRELKSVAISPYTTAIGEYAFYNCIALESINIPDSVTRIGQYAFNGCSSLYSITILDNVTSIGFRAFFACGAGFTIFTTPGSYVAEYANQNAINIHYIGNEDVAELKLSLPSDAEDYNDLTITLLNLQSDISTSQTVNQNSSYTFGGLKKGDTYRATITNKYGNVLSVIESIELSEAVVTATFPAFEQTKTINVIVSDVNGINVSGQIKIFWYNAEGDYLEQGPSVSGVIPGFIMKYIIELDLELGSVYIEPEVQEHTVSSGDNSIAITLVPIPKVTISGRVIDRNTRNPVAGAEVSVYQMLNGKYQNNIIVSTITDGTFSAIVYNDISTVTVSAENYINAEITFLNLGSGVDLGDIELRPVEGVSITVNAFYTNRVPTGEIPLVTPLLNPNDASFTLYNQTTGREITEFTVQYPRIILLEPANADNLITVTATSRSGDFKTVSATATVGADRKAIAELYIVQNGALQLILGGSGNIANIALLYDTERNLVDTYSYRGLTVETGVLPEGNYTVISISKSLYFNDLLSISAIEYAGLIENIDYVKTVATVKAGEITVVDAGIVPALDESKLYYTENSKVSFTVNKTSAVAGSYFILRGELEFKDEYQDAVSNVKLIVDLSENCELIPLSVLTDTTLGSYTISGTTVIIPLSRYRDTVRFCVLPTIDGIYMVNAYVEFDLGGQTLRQPIGAVRFSTEVISIGITNKTASKTVTAMGTVTPSSNVVLYDNGIIVGQTTALKNGEWIMCFELNEKYNWGVHEIYAKVYTPQGGTFTTEIRDVVYDESWIEVSKVTMYYLDTAIVFDYISPVISTGSYSFNPFYNSFTFKAEFTKNDPTIITGVVINVRTTSGKSVSLPAVFSAVQGGWVANGYFSATNLPINVKVDYLQDSTYIASLEFVDEIELEMQEEEEALNEIIRNAPYDEEAYAEFIDKAESPDEIIDDLDVKIQSINTRIEKIETEIDDFLQNAGITITEDGNVQFNDKEISISTVPANGMSESTLLADGFQKIETTSGGALYQKFEETQATYVNLAENTVTRMDTASIIEAFGIQAIQPASTRASGIEDALDLAVETATAIVDQLENIYNRFIQPLEQTIDDLAFEKHGLSLQRQGLVQDLKVADTVIAGKTFDNLDEFFTKFNNVKAQQGVLDSKISQVLGKLSNLTSLSKAFKYIKIGGYIDTIYQIIGKAIQWKQVYRSIPNHVCMNRQKEVEVIISELNSLAINMITYFTVSLVLSSSSIIGSVASGGLALAITAGVIVGSIAASIQFEKYTAGKFSELKGRIKKLDCACGCNNGVGPLCEDGCVEKEEEDDDDGLPPPPPPIDAKPTIDPSGFVYEAVPSNRLEEVTTTIYYKETLFDIYGDPYEEIVLWDAWEYAQKNPLTTDSEGRYAWDVPIGMWQVMYEKDGYETTYSEWLPVPPPQVEVNIPMTTYAAPEVTRVNVYAEGVEIAFSKYMDITTLNTANITASIDGAQVGGSIIILNAEEGIGGTEYTSKIRFVPDVPFGLGQSVGVFISVNAMSYAGAHLVTAYSVTLPVTAEPRSIGAETTLMQCDSTQTAVITIEPKEAAAGKKLIITSSTPAIAIAPAEVIIDSDGNAYIPVTALLPGTAYFTVKLEGTDIETQIMVDIYMEQPEPQIEKAAAPTANPPGGEIEKGAKVSLSTTSEGAMIHYTIDGSVPNIMSPMYSTPIEVNEDVTIRAITIMAGMDNSDVADFVYTIIDPGVEPPETFTVAFVDWDGIELKLEIVEKGKSATAPADPTREGYAFSGWDKDFSSITNDLTVTAQYTIDTGKPVIVSVMPSAYVTKLNGNKNDLTITVTERYSDGTTKIATETFKINNNAADTYIVGIYTIYVNTKGNDVIRECYIVK